MSSLAALQGCGDDEEDTGGKGGSSGNAGEAGDGGTSGSAGSSGSSGRGGSSGSGGQGGTAGASGGTGGSVSGAGGAPGGAGGAGGEGGATQTRAEVCTDYCQAWVDKDCDRSAANTYTDEPDCRDVCNAADWELGEPGDATGNSVHCRLWHTGLAAAPNPDPDETHCGHASENSTGQCVN